MKTVGSLLTLKPKKKLKDELRTTAKQTLFLTMSLYYRHVSIFKNDPQMADFRFNITQKYSGICDEE